MISENVGRVRVLDTLKGICITFVIISHFTWSEQERRTLLFPFWIDMAVPFFMLISGYVNSIAYEKKKITSIAEAYKWRRVVEKIIRFTVPYVIAFIVETLIYHSQGMEFTGISLFYIFWRGGFGAGSYYWPIMIQFIFVFPIVYFIIKNNPVRGLIVMLFANIVFEITQISYGFSESSYRLLLFRYLFLIGFGCFLHVYKDKLSIKWNIILMLIGVASIISYRYCGKTSVFLNYWIGTSYVCSMLIIPIFALIVRKFSGKYIPGVEMIGKASFNIFLAQMIYYDIPQDYIAKVMGSRVFHLLFSLVICTVVGLGFYKIEGCITKKIIRLLDKLFMKHRSIYGENSLNR